MEGAFRKIDIDAYDEDVIQESELYDADPRDPSQVLDEAKQRQVAARNAQNKYVSCYMHALDLLADIIGPRNDISGALGIALENAPYGPNVDEAKASLVVALFKETSTDRLRRL